MYFQVACDTAVAVGRSCIHRYFGGESDQWPAAKVLRALVHTLVLVDLGHVDRWWRRIMCQQIAYLGCVILLGGMAVVFETGAQGNTIRLFSIRWYATTASLTALLLSTFHIFFTLHFVRMRAELLRRLVAHVTIWEPYVYV